MKCLKPSAYKALVIIFFFAYLSSLTAQEPSENFILAPVISDKAENGRFRNIGDENDYIFDTATGAVYFCGRQAKLSFYSPNECELVQHGPLTADPLMKKEGKVKNNFISNFIKKLNLFKDVDENLPRFIGNDKNGKRRVFLELGLNREGTKRMYSMSFTNDQGKDKTRIVNEDDLCDIMGWCEE